MWQVRAGGAPPRAALQRLQRVHIELRPPLPVDQQVHRRRQPHQVLRISGVDSHLPHLHHSRVRGLHERQSRQNTTTATQQASVIVHAHIVKINQGWIISILMPRVGGNLRDSITSLRTLATKIFYSPGRISTFWLPAPLNSPFNLKFIFVNSLHNECITLPRGRSRTSYYCRLRSRKRCRRIRPDGRTVLRRAT